MQPIDVPEVVHVARDQLRAGRSLAVQAVVKSGGAFHLTLPRTAVDLEVNENRSKKTFSFTSFSTEKQRFIGVFEFFVASFTKITTLGRSTW